MSKPIKSPSRATALLIKKGGRKNENRNNGHILWPRDIRIMAIPKPPKIQ